MAHSFVLDEKFIPVSSKLATAIGLEEATVFQQLYYSLQNPKMAGKIEAGQKWIRNPIKSQDSEKQERAQEHGKAIDWLSNFPFLSSYRIRCIFAKLERLGLVISQKLRAARWDHCKYYTIDNQKLAELLEVLKLPICRKSTHPFVETQHIHLSTVDKSYQDTISDISFQDSERESGAGNKNWEEEMEAIEDLSLQFDKKPETVIQPEIYRSDKSSAAAPGPELIDPDSLREFQVQLENLGKHLGRKSPVAWAYAIVKNLSANKLCTYWEEFKAGMPLGASEQKEWEIAPGVACTIAIQCLEQDYLSRPGTTPQEAALKAARTIARPKEMAAVWESIKAQVMFRRSEWQRQSAIGVQSPVLDSWMVPKPSVSMEEVAIALIEIQSALPVALLPAVPVAELAESAIGETTTDDTAAIVTAAKAKISAVLSKFARPTKRVATLAANMVAVKSGIISPAKTPTSGGLADYLFQTEIADEEIW